MSDTLCPKCNAKGAVKVKSAKSDKGQDIKYYECGQCRSLWTNSNEIASLAVEA
jgi:Zn-finger nucleic acid-binding protein